MNTSYKTIPKNQNIVDIKDEDELKYWAKFFNTSTQKLVNIVKEVGSEKEKVATRVRKIKIQSQDREYER